MTLHEILQQLKGVTGSNNQYNAICPAHNDHKASLSISAGEDGRILLQCHAGCDVKNITAALGITMRDLFPPEADLAGRQNRNIVAIYEYKDAEGQLLAQKIRYDNKSFSWRKPDGRGDWEYKRGNIKVLYNLPEVIKGDPIFIVEGEKDCETLRKLGLVATTAPDGAGSKNKWDSSFNEYFRRKTVLIIPDNDAPGRELAKAAAENLQGIAESIKILDLAKAVPNLPEKADASDIAAQKGLTGLEAILNKLSNETPEYNTIGFECLSNIQSTRTKWLWEPYIPLGKITLLTADPGAGKTFFALYLAARTSTGLPFFGEKEGRMPGKVIYQTAEDGISDTIRPRLDSMNPKANLSNIYIINESQKGLSLLDKRIEKALQLFRPKLIVFDPLQAYLGADVDMHRANEVRPVLAQIGRLAEQYECAVIFIMHMSKMSQSQALYRGLGSIDIPAVARSMLILGKHPENPQDRILCHEKSSLAQHGKSIVFRIAPEMGGLLFSGYSDLKADDILKATKSNRNKRSVGEDEAVNLLQEMLGEEGYCRLKDIQAAAAMRGISKTTLYRAKENLFLKSMSLGFSGDKATWWHFPNVDQKSMQAKLGKDEVDSQYAGQAQ